MGKDDLKQLIAQARLDEAVSQLLEQIRAYSTTSKYNKFIGQLSDILIINSGKLHGLQHDKMLGIVDRPNEQVTMAQVQLAIVYVINELPDEFWNTPALQPNAMVDRGKEVEPKANSTSEKINSTNLVGNDHISLQNLTNSSVTINVNSSDKKQQPTSAETHGDLEDPEVSKIKIKGNRKKLIYLASPFILIAFVVSIVYFSIKKPESVTKSDNQQPANNAFAKVDSLVPKMVLIKGGEFTMGSPENEFGRQKDETQHQVKLSDFYMCKFEVTVADFKKFVDDSIYMTDAEKGDGSYMWNGKEWKKEKGINWRFGVSGKKREIAEYNHPVVHVSWNDAVAYCDWLSAKTGTKYQLPTEAEWEYACRAGTTTPFNTGNNLTTSQANYNGNYPYNNNPKGEYREKTMPVGSFSPNSWGLYDMHGNVYEWCSDWYSSDYYAISPQNNPKGPSSGSSRVLRGGSWEDCASSCRVSSRDIKHPAYGNANFGFRLVRSF